ncbi:hypothetical protein EUA31_09560 [Neisseria meningitidis]|nr:hypothetical protein [Neisseria meningitidis]MCI3178346.1 hypothetical protein [Neisseria meningitidis]PHP21908.1 hypothetical protein CSH32_11995 [Neisseria meningitidis]TNL22300.1 hypothetical protein EUA24_09735 [Neisseria meningitidis]TNL22519.1 hypothetical protein EUA34_12025 [Neisseria meningitidis]
MFGNHGLCGLLKEGAHEKSPKCLGGNLGNFGEFCKGLRRQIATLPFKPSAYPKQQTGEKPLPLITDRCGSTEMAARIAGSRAFDNPISAVGNA